MRTEAIESGQDARKACIEERSVVGNYVGTAEVLLTTQTGPSHSHPDVGRVSTPRRPNATVGGGFRGRRASVQFENAAQGGFVDMLADHGGPPGNAEGPGWWGLRGVVYRAGGLADGVGLGGYDITWGRVTPFERRKAL